MRQVVNRYDMAVTATSFSYEALFRCVEPLYRYFSLQGLTGTRQCR